MQVRLLSGVPLGGPHARVAQRNERPAHNREAPGSIPGAGTVAVAQRQSRRAVTPEHEGSNPSGHPKGARRRWRVGAGRNPVAARFRGFESLRSHQCPCSSADRATASEAEGRWFESSRGYAKVPCPNGQGLARKARSMPVRFRPGLRSAIHCGHSWAGPAAQSPLIRAACPVRHRGPRGRAFRCADARLLRLARSPPVRRTRGSNPHGRAST